MNYLKASTRKTDVILVLQDEAEYGFFGTTPRKGLFEVSLVFAMNLFNLLIKFEKIGVSVL